MILPNRPVMVERREAKLFVGKMTQPGERIAGAHPPGRHIGQQGLERAPIHAAEATGSRYWWNRTAASVMLST